MGVQFSLAIASVCSRRNRRLPVPPCHNHPLERLLGLQEAARKLKCNWYRMLSATVKPDVPPKTSQFQFPMKCVTRVRKIQFASGLIPSAMIATKNTQARLMRCSFDPLEAHLRAHAGYYNLLR
jgi:hypothetical protein